MQTNVSLCVCFRGPNGVHPLLPTAAVVSRLILWASFHQNDSRLINSKTGTCLLPTPHPIQPETLIYSQEIGGRSTAGRPHVHVTLPCGLTSVPADTRGQPGRNAIGACPRQNLFFRRCQLTPWLWMFKFSSSRTSGVLSLYLI